MSLLRKFAGETIIYGISSILPKILHFIVFTIYLTHKFDNTGDFGIYTFLYGYVAILIVLFTMRMDTAFFRFGSRNNNLNKAFSTASVPVFVISIIAGMLIYFNASEITNIIGFPGNEKYIKWFAFILCFDAMTALPFAKMRLSNQPNKFLFYRFLNVLLTIIFVLFTLEIIPRFGTDAMKNNFSSFKKLDYVFLANLFASTIVFILLIKEYFNSKFDFDASMLKKMFKYSWPLIIVGIAAGINQAFAVPLQTLFLGEDKMANISNAGVYAAAAKIAILLSLAITAFNYAAEPFFFNHFKNTDSKEIYGKVGLIYTIVATVILLAIGLFMDVLINLVGPEYRAAKYVIPILLYAYLFLGLYYNFSIWYKLTDRTIYGAYISIGGAVITLLISIILLPNIGDVASAWAALACYVFMAIMGLYFGRKYYKIDYPLKKMTGYVVLSIIILGLSILFKKHYSASSYLFLLFNFFLFAGFCFFIWRLDKKIIKELL